MQPLEEQGETTYSRKWLIAPALVGLGLVVFNVVWTHHYGTDPYNAIPGVLSDIGVTLLLFSVLFLFEKRIEKRILRSIQVLTKQESDEMLSKLADDPLVFGDFEAEMGPMSTGQTITDALARRDFNAIWILSDPNLRLCRAQAWIFNNVESLGLRPEPDDKWNGLAEYLINGPHPGERLWDEFAKLELKVLLESFGGIPMDKWGWSNRRRIVGPRHEVLLLVPMPDNAPYGFVARGPTTIEDAHMLLFRCIGEDEGATDGPFYLFAGTGESAPLPGWPPTFWNHLDPVARANHPGANVLTPDPPAPAEP